jgi:hypothetical protein
MMISGDNHLFGRAETTDSYYFSRYPHVWGWATWRRAWAKYDVDMTHWPEIRDRNLFDQYFQTASERYYWESVFQHTYDRKIDTWAYPWAYSMWANSGLSTAPARNLVHNIGFHAGATHTKTKSDSVYASLGANDLVFPLTHPATVLANSDKDELEAKVRASHIKGALKAWTKFFALQVLVRRARRRLARNTGQRPVLTAPQSSPSAPVPVLTSGNPLTAVSRRAPGR